MLKKTITFEDLDGNPVTEDFYFNLNKAELAALELSTEGGYAEHLTKLAKAEKGKEIIQAFDEILRTSIGRRSEDGKRFIKSSDVWEEFKETDAYSVLFMELITSENGASEFVEGIMPKDLVEETRKTETLELPAEGEEDKRPSWMQENREPTKAELVEMPREEMMLAMQWKSEGRFAS